MSTTTFNELRELDKSVNSNFEYSGVDHASLAYDADKEDLMIDSEGYRELGFTDNGRKKMLKSIGMPGNMFNNLIEKSDPQTINNLIGQFVRAKVNEKDDISPMGVKFNGNGEIVDGGFHKSRGMSNQKILDLMEEQFSENPSLNILGNSTVNDDGILTLNISADGYDKIYPFGEDVGYEKDYFSIGTSLYNDPNGVQNGTKFESYIERLICSNGMRGNFLSYKTRASNNDMVKALVNKFGLMSDDNLFQDIAGELTLKLDTSFNTNASLNEVEQVVKMLEKKIKDGADNEEQAMENVGKLYEAFNMSGISSHYGDEWRQESNGWKQTANSGIKHYDAFNLGTYFASHDDFKFDLDDKHDLQYKYSRMLFDNEVDLLNVAPSKNMPDLLSSAKERKLFDLV